MPTVRCRQCSANVRVSDSANRAKAHCPKCGNRLPDDEDFAADILADTTPVKRARTDRTFEDMQIFEEAPKATIEPTKPATTAKKYGALRAVSVLMTLSSVASFFLFMAAAVSFPKAALAYFVAGVVSSLVLYSLGEIASILVTIEENTRR